MKYSFLPGLIFSLILLISCTSEKVKEDASIETNDSSTSIEETGNYKFWSKITSLCGETYRGKIISGQSAGDFQGKELIMHVLSCDEDKILIPFNVGENRSRTWILTKDQEQRITLKHDHRKEDGTNDEISMYGGTTPNSGLSSMAIFPADQETIDLINYAGTNVWWITVSDESFTYNLKRIGSESQFSVSFDLTNPVEQPQASWGWEGFEVN